MFPGLVTRSSASGKDAGILGRTDTHRILGKKDRFPRGGIASRASEDEALELERANVSERIENGS